MGKINTVPWQRISIGSPSGSRTLTGLHHPKDYFQHNFGKYSPYFRRTGRTTYMILKILADINAGKRVAVMAYIGTAIQRIGTNITDYGNQIDMKLQFSERVVQQWNMDRSQTRDAVCFFTPHHGLNDLIGRTYDMIYVDNAIHDIALNVDHVFREAARVGAKMDVPRIEDSSVFASDGEKFSVGDLIKIGNKNGMISDIATVNGLPHSIVLFIEGGLEDISASLVDMLEKVG